MARRHGAIALQWESPKGAVDPNTRGWESIASRWKDVTWPRRPRWGNEFDKAGPLLSGMRGKEALVFGSTPEFRAWLAKAGARVSVMEKSVPSYLAMTRIAAGQSCAPLLCENVIREDWESPNFEKGRYHLAMGDIVLGYLETKERLHAFLEKVHSMLKSDGVFLLRDFTDIRYRGDDQPCLPVHERRWAYILTKGFAIEGGTFHEGLLAHNLARIGDAEALATCANPPRTRLMLPFMEMNNALEDLFEARLLCPPAASGTARPALWGLHKR